MDILVGWVSCTKMSQDTSDFSVYTPSQWHPWFTTQFTLIYTHRESPELAEAETVWQLVCVSQFSRLFWVCQCCLVKNSVCLCIIKNNDQSFLKGNISAVWAYFGYCLCSISSSVQDSTHRLQTDRVCMKMQSHCSASILIRIQRSHPANSLTLCVCVYLGVFVCVCSVFVLNQKDLFCDKTCFFSVSLSPS